MLRIWWRVMQMQCKRQANIAFKQEIIKSEFYFIFFFVSRLFNNKHEEQIYNINCQATAGAGGAQRFETISESVFPLRLFQVNQV